MLSATRRTLLLAMSSGRVCAPAGETVAMPHAPMAHAPMASAAMILLKHVVVTPEVNSSSPQAPIPDACRSSRIDDARIAPAGVVSAAGTHDLRDGLRPERKALGRRRPGAAVDQAPNIGRRSRRALRTRRHPCHAYARSAGPWRRHGPAGLTRRVPDRRPKTAMLPGRVEVRAEDVHRPVRRLDRLSHPELLHVDILRPIVERVVGRQLDQTARCLPSMR